MVPQHWATSPMQEIIYVFRVQKRLIMIDETFVVLASISSAPGGGISGKIMAGELLPTILFKLH